METVLWLAVATASISFTLSPRTKAFDWLRDYLGRHIEKIDLEEPGALDPAYLQRDRLADRWLAVQLHSILSCPYCISHWVAFLLTILFHPMPITGYFIDLFPVAFAMVTVSALLLYVMQGMNYTVGILRDAVESGFWPRSLPIEIEIKMAGEKKVTANENFISPEGEMPEQDPPA